MLSVRQFARRAGEFEARGVQLVRVFHSPVESLASFAVGEHSVPFPVLADPNKKAYKAYGVGAGILDWLAMLKPSALRRSVAAARSGLRPSWRHALRDGMTSRPADFLIAPDGKLLRIHRGRDFTNSLPVDDALCWLDELGIDRAEPVVSPVGRQES